MFDTIIKSQPYHKAGYTSPVKIKQLRYEINTRKRLLDFIKDENIHMKNRISEILNDRFDKYLLEEVDGFQTSLIREDHLIALLRNEITELDTLLAKDLPKDDKLLKKTEIKLKRLHKNMNVAEKQFGKLKFNFHKFLSKNII
jgi:hypothetical protein